MPLVANWVEEPNGYIVSSHSDRQLAAADADEVGQIDGATFVMVDDVFVIPVRFEVTTEDADLDDIGEFTYVAMEASSRHPVFPLSRGVTKPTSARVTPDENAIWDFYSNRKPTDEPPSVVSMRRHRKDPNEWIIIIYPDLWEMDVEYEENERRIEAALAELLGKDADEFVILRRIRDSIRIRDCGRRCRNTVPRSRRARIPTPRGATSRLQP